jgi:hypothetical protein
MSALTMASDQQSMSTIHPLPDVDEEREEKEDEDHHGPLKPDDPEYPQITQAIEDEYETDSSSDLEGSPKKKRDNDKGDGLKKSGECCRGKAQGKACSFVIRLSSPYRAIYFSLSFFSTTNPIFLYCRPRRLIRFTLHDHAPLPPPSSPFPVHPSPFTLHPSPFPSQAHLFSSAKICKTAHRDEF